MKIMTALCAIFFIFVVTAESQAQSPVGRFTCELKILTSGTVNSYTFDANGGDVVVELSYATDGKPPTFHESGERPRWSYLIERNLITLADLATPPYRIVVLDKAKFDRGETSGAMFKRQNDSASFFAIGDCTKHKVGNASAQVPRFEDFPIVALYAGPNASVVLQTKDDINFRTRLRAAAKQRPNFAGQYVVETWGCGTSCQMSVVIDVKTGIVTHVPFSICCASPETGSFQAVTFRRDSRMIVFRGLRNEEGDMGAHFYTFDGKQFVFLKTIRDNGTFQDQ